MGTICPACKGNKYLEFEAGLIRLRCEICKGKGKIDESVGGDGHNNQALGVKNPSESWKPRKRKAGKGIAAKHS